MNRCHSKLNSLAKVSALGVISCLGLSGCFLTEMAKMPKNTSQMNSKMDQTNSTVSSTLDVIHAQFLSLRKGDTVQIRSRALQDMQHYSEMGAKLKAAAVYMKALEFQLFEPAIEGQQRREILFEEATSEFFKLVHEFASERSNASVKSTSESQKNLYALVTAMHEVNTRQELAVSGTQYPVVSLFDLIAQALDMLSAVENGSMRSSDVPEWARKVQESEQDAKYVLQVRHNFLIAYGFAMSAAPEDGDSLSFLQRGRYLIGNGMLGIDWDPVFNDRNTIQLEYYSSILETALKTRDVLVRNAYDTKTDQSILKIFRNIDWSDVEGAQRLTGTESTNALERHALIQRLKDVIARVLS